jgi:hypothetical protein
MPEPALDDPERVLHVAAASITGRRTVNRRRRQPVTGSHYRSAVLDSMLVLVGMV